MKKLFILKNGKLAKTKKKLFLKILKVNVVSFLLTKREKLLFCQLFMEQGLKLLKELQRLGLLVRLFCSLFVLLFPLFYSFFINVSDFLFLALSSIDAGFFGRGIYFSSYAIYTLPFILRRSKIQEIILPVRNEKQDMEKKKRKQIRRKEKQKPKRRTEKQRASPENK